MPFDAIFLSAVTEELGRELPGARIDKIQQPERDTVLMTVRAQAMGSKKLLLSASSNHPRIQFTQSRYENPAQPPMFCMLLRKHLAGGRILGLRQLPMERAVELSIESADEMGLLSEKKLYLELMGRNSNLILVGPDGRVLDCLRRVDFEMSEKRQVLPGLFYHEPPSQGKLDPREETLAALQAALAGQTLSQTLDRWLMDRYAGISPLIARELSYLAAGQTDADVTALTPAQQNALFDALMGLFTGHTPTLLYKADAAKDFTFRPVLQYGDYYKMRTMDSFSELLEEFYAGRDRKERLRAKSQTLHKTLTTLHSRVVRKLAMQEKELAATHDRERLRQWGDIVTANLYQIRRGQSHLTAVNFYDPEMQPIDIPLDVTLSPQQNAAKYYKAYNKAKHAEKFLTQQLEAGRAEETYLASVLESLSRAESERDVSEIRQELIQGGYVKNNDKKKQMKQTPTRPMRFRSSDGFEILVGRNNRQNDELTCKLAYKSDLWLHTQKIHGSHVIIACAGTRPPDQTITEAAQLAAYYSQARQGQNVAVDLCPVRQVKKPNGAKPGMVVYENYNTVYVTPDPALPARLSVQE